MRSIKKLGFYGPQWLFVCCLCILIFLNSPVFAQRVNLAKYQTVTSDSDWNSDQIAAYVTDGIVGNNNRWASASGSSHWAEISFRTHLEFGSAHIFGSGTDESNVLTDFRLQYHNGSTWVDIPGAIYSGNTAMEVNCIFATPVTSNKIRMYSTDSVAHLKELALFPPNGGAGYPLGTDVTINLAKHRFPAVSSTSGSNRAMRALDGYVDDSSRWLSDSSAGPHWMEVNLQFTSKIGSAHLYSGYQTDPSSGISDFVLQYWNGSNWIDIPGANITGNNTQALAIDFTTDVSTSKVRLYITEPGNARVRELVVFPANQDNGYPLGTNVLFEGRNTKNFKDYHDHFYAIRNKVNRHAIEPVNGSPILKLNSQLEQQYYQVLYIVNTDYYRLRNWITGKTLEVAGASKTAGATIQEADDYTEMPHQLWELEHVSGDYYRFVNVFSGMVLSVDGSGGNGEFLIQEPVDGSDKQQWEIDYLIHYPKKGLGGYEDTAKSHLFGFSYNWGMGGSADHTDFSHPLTTNFYPMQWGSYSWDKPRKRAPGWHRLEKQPYYMGFNEPDSSSQSNITVSKALELWPRLMQANVPLLSPGAVNPQNSWATSFMDQAEDLGYRIEYYAVHKYPTPNAGGFISELNSTYNRYGKPVIVTEWSVVDWSGSGTWTYEDTYTYFAEVFWRVEGLDYVKGLGVFPFSGDTTGKRSNFFENGALTPVGRFVCAWDGDRTIRAYTPYFIHNLGYGTNLENASGSPVPGDIRTIGRQMQWIFVSTGTNSNFYVESLADGDRSRLSYTGSTLSLAAPGTVGTSVEWKRTSISNGFFYIDHPSTGKRLIDDNGVLVMVGSGSSKYTWERAKWRFIKPLYRGSESNYYVVHKASGKIMSYSGSNVQLVDAATTGDDVEWSKVRADKDWLYLDNIGASASAERLHNNSGGVDLSASIWRGDNMKWQLVAAEQGWYRLKNKSTGNWLHSSDGTNVDQVAASDTSDDTRWKLVKVDSYYLVHKGSGRKMRYADDPYDEVDLAEDDATDEELRWTVRQTGSVWNILDNVAAPIKYKRLHAKSSQGFDVNMTDTQWTDGNLHWEFIDAGNGWMRISHETSSGDWLHSSDGVTVDLVASSDTSDNTKWRLISLLNVPPIAPIGLHASAAGGGIVLDWDDNSESDLAGYHVYRSTTFGGGYSLIAGAVPTSSFTDLTAVDDVRYYYVVAAINDAWNRSDYSNEVTAEYYVGDLDHDGLVNMEDVDELSTDWQLDYNMDSLIALAEDWLRDSSLLAYWPLDGNANDTSGSEFHGIPYGNPVWEAAGYEGGAIQLDGIDDYVEIPGYAGIPGSSARTCSMWIKTSNDGILLSYGNFIAGEKWLWGLLPTGSLQLVVGGGNTTGSMGLTDNQWHHVAVVLPEGPLVTITDVQFYVDGQPDAVTPSGSQLIHTTAGENFHLGAFDAAGEMTSHWAGLMDDVRIYNRALSQQEIQLLIQ